MIIQLSIVASLVLTLIGLITIIYRIGTTKQALSDAIDSLKIAEGENKRKVDKMLEELTSHCKDDELHVNSKLEERTYNENMQWRRNVDSKLDTLIRSKSSTPST